MPSACICLVSGVQTQDSVKTIGGLLEELWEVCTSRFLGNLLCGAQASQWPIRTHLQDNFEDSHVS